MSSPEEKYFPIRARFFPDYYPEFHCIADKCQDSCCFEWNINLTKNDYMTLRRECQSGDLKERFDCGIRRIRGEKATDKNYARFVLKDRSCVFLNEAGFCGLQLACGEKNIPGVCKKFPRVIGEMPWGLKEFSCSLACEAVLHLLYQRKDGLGFVMEDIPEEEQTQYTFPKEDPLGEGHGPVRELCIDILQERTLSLPHRMLLLGWALRDLAQGIPADLEQWVGQKRALLGADEVHELLEQFKGNTQLCLMHQISQLTLMLLSSRPMVELREQIFALLEVERKEGDVLTLNVLRYRQAEEELRANYGDLEFFLENMLVNVFFNMQYPVWGGLHDIWKNYVNLCNFYSMSRFAMVCGCHGHSDLEQLFHVQVLISRSFLHNATRQSGYTQVLTENESTTLADMAILVCG